MPVAFLILVVSVVAIVLLRRGSSTPDQGPSREKAFVQKLGELTQSGKYPQARKLLEKALEEDPKSGFLNFTLGRVLFELGAIEKALPHFKVAVESSADVPPDGAFWIGWSLASLDRHAEALPFLERTYADKIESRRKRILSQCYVILGRHEEALGLLADFARAVEPIHWRYRALIALGRDAEVQKQLEQLAKIGETNPSARAEHARLRATTLRERGDFDGALRLLEAALETLPRGQMDWLRLHRAILAVHVESGDAAAIERVSELLLPTNHPGFFGRGLWYRSMGRLIAGKKEDAVASATEFLERVQGEYSILRQERLMMRHLIAEVNDAAVTAEARATSPGRANDLYFYLALATGKGEWARKGLGVTQRNNFPHHALKRLVGDK